MKKSLVYYLSQIKLAYPEITDITGAEYEAITAEINAQISAGQPVTAHKQLYGKTYRFLKWLANYYAENGLDYRSFVDNLSALQLEIMQKINNKAANQNWFLNFPSFIPGIHHCFKLFMKRYQNETESQNKVRAKLVENLLNDEVIRQVYEKELNDLKHNELRALIKEALKTLNPAEQRLLCDFYGLTGEEQSKAEIARAKGLTYETISRKIGQALVKLRNPMRGRKMYEFYKLDD